MVPLHKSLGPLSIANLGLQYKDGALWLIFDASAADLAKRARQHPKGHHPDVDDGTGWDKPTHEEVPAIGKGVPKPLLSEVPPTMLTGVYYLALAAVALSDPVTM